MTIEGTEYNKRLVEIEMINNRLKQKETYLITGYCKDLKNDSREGNFIKFASFIAHITTLNPTFNHNLN